ncbi:MAG: cyclic nucleotide-binding domain-containing protein [Myxococcota bacterium]|jgi:CRP-like cAMP-binding protein|nr:cyclic nucleotide-binding domain-containing protein [Myxococcota bacterium]
MNELNGGDLRCFAFFANYDDDELEQFVLPFLTTQRYPSGKVICRERTPGDRCFFLLAGDVEVQTTVSNGSVETIGQLSPGTVFGQLVLLDGGLRSATCVAHTDCQLLELSKSDFEVLRQRGSRLAFDLLLEISSSLAAQIRQATENLSAMSESRVQDPAAVSQRLEAQLRDNVEKDHSSQSLPQVRLAQFKL